jgi:hypothetical protein
MKESEVKLTKFLNLNYSVMNGPQSRFGLGHQEKNPCHFRESNPVRL